MWRTGFAWSELYTFSPSNMRALPMAEATMLYLGGHLTYPFAQTSTHWGKMPLAADVDTCGKRFRSCQLIACENAGVETMMT